MISVIGDGSLTGGMAYEALNNAAEMKTNFIIVLNDNHMSISKNVGGMSSSLPEDVQYAMYRSVPGLEHAKIVRNAYAIEYDCIDARQLKSTLEFKEIEGLFSGGQFNGSSGYDRSSGIFLCTQQREDGFVLQYPGSQKEALSEWIYDRIFDVCRDFSGVRSN